MSQITTWLNQILDFEGLYYKYAYSFEEIEVLELDIVKALVPLVDNAPGTYTSVKSYGAIGDGVTTDTAAIQAAFNSGYTNIIFPAGVYLTGPLTTTQVGQKLSVFGATVKLKSASSGALLTANASGVEIMGGTWDVNNIAQNGIVMSGSYCSVQFTTLQNCGAAGIYGMNNAQYLTIERNTIKDAVTYGIYVEGLTSDCYGNKILHNDIDTSATASAKGIYLTGPNDESFHQYDWDISHNYCKGSVSTPTGVGITARAIDGTLDDNKVSGYTIGVSADITTDSVISNNKVKNVTGGTAYSIEVGGGDNEISNNKTVGGAYGIIVNSATKSVGGNVISGNKIKNPTSVGIYILPAGGQTGRFNTVNNNNIDLSVAGQVGIELFNDCIHTNFSCNTIRGPGSGISGSRAIYLNTPAAAAFIGINGNKCTGFERAFTVYSAGALTVTDLTSNGNDLSSDVSQSTVGWSFEGSAACGTRVNHIGSKNVNGSYLDVHDTLTNVFTLRSDSYNSPEGGLYGGIGSIFISLNSGQVPYVKSTGAGTNTGWVAL